LQGWLRFRANLPLLPLMLTAKFGTTPQTTLGCTAFTAGFFTGSLALIQRGGCTFAIKATNAANAGATGVVLFQSVGGPPSTAGGLTGTPPVVMIDLAGGLALRDYVVANPTALQFALTPQPLVHC
jgi:hypothetical protein